MGKRKQDNPQRDYATKRIKRGMGYGKTNLKKAVEQILRKTTELKEIGKAFSQNPTSAGGAIAYINDAISTGADITDRVGRHIVSKQIQVNYEVYVTGQTFDSGFIALVYDRQPNGAFPSFGDVFNLGSFGTALAFKNTAANGDRFKVVKMEKWAVGSPGPVNQYGRLFYKIPEALADTEYEDQTASPPSSGMWMVLVGANHNAGTSTWADYTIKYQYTDK